MPKAVGGDLIWRALEAEWGSDDATARATAVGTFFDRGDWGILRRWNAGELHVSELLRAVREGDYERLKRLNVDGYLLGRGVREIMVRVEATRAPGTIRNYDMVTRALLAHFEADGPRAMHDITTAEAEEFLHAPRGEDSEPWAENTQRQYRMVASALWNFAIEREREEAEKAGAVATVRRNPWRGAEVRRGRRIKPNVLTEEERDDMLAHPDVTGTPQATLVAIAFLAGLRQAEITHLRTADDVELWPQSGWTALLAGYLHVQSRKGEIPWMTKTPNSERSVPIVPRLGRILLEHIARGYAGRTYFMRPERADKPISGDTALRWTRQVFEAAGIEYGRAAGDGLTLHSGRHTCATVLLSHAVPLAEVAEWLGDTQQQVLRDYSHAIMRDRELALRVLEGANE